MLYLENSYDQFTFASTVTGWITVTDTESAAASGNAGLGTRVWTPLKEAVRIWAALPGNDLAEFDENGDGYVPSGPLSLFTLCSPPHTSALFLCGSCSPGRPCRVHGIAIPPLTVAADVFRCVRHVGGRVTVSCRAVPGRYIDAITFIHSGMAAEWGGTDCFGARYRSRVWSHKWAFFDEDFRADGVRVYNYNISPGQWGRTCTAAQAAATAAAAHGCTAAETLPIGHIGVIAHELGHYIGLPDMYDGAGGHGIGSYDLMANSWGHDGTQNNPPPFSAATKMSLGWIVPTPVTPTASGTALTVVHGKSRLYQVSPPSAADTNREPSVYANAYYQISAGFGDPANEYFLLEVSSNYGHHRAQPCQGLLLWHVDAGKGYLGSGLDSGETCFPYNLVHYTTALVQADGLYELERGSNRHVLGT
jgi:M6 family metalloprotease-like protein